MSRLPLIGAAFSPSVTAAALVLGAVHRSTRRGFRPSLFVCATVTCLLALVSPASAKTAMQEYVEAMQPGWNLGNTLDATPNETAWGNPLTTQALIQNIKAQGFKSIRIPITWDTGNRVGPAPSYTVDPAWLDRVQQIVDWSLAAGLYVMINMHHDSYWINKMPSDHDAVLAKFNAVWSQVAPRFRDYPRELMFESINEPDFPNTDDATRMSLLNELNTSFFHIVRNTGGGNATRPLVLPSYNTNSGQQWIDSLKATMDSLNDSNLIATVHFYGFWPFSVNIAGVTTVNDAVINDINATVNNTYNTFIANGIPVIIGELGLLNWGPGSLSVERGEVLKFFEIFTAAARAKGITWQLWDAGQLLDRTTFQWKDQELMDYYFQSVTTRSSTAATDLVFLRDGTPVQDAVINLNLNGNTFLSLDDGATPLVPGWDYLINGSVLTIKASTLASYASGALGEKTVLKANFSSGMPWKFHVRHESAPALAAASGTKGAPNGLTIPTAFNGDLVATMEAKYVTAPGYPYPGPASWTSFKGYDDGYIPDYANNKIVIKKQFFAETTNDPVDLTFYMWSGRKVHYRLTFQTGGGDGEGDVLSIYQDGLVGWHNWGGWGRTTNADDTTVVHSGTAAMSVTIDPGTWGAIDVEHNSWEPAIDTSAYKTLVFWIHGGAVGGQKLGLTLDWNTWVSVPTPTANTWTKVEIPLSDLGVAGKSDITHFVMQDWSGSGASTFYLDDIKLITGGASNLVFVNGAPAPVITSSLNVHGAYNTPFNHATTAINNPTSFSATGLPPGFAIDTNTGVISGTPTVLGSYPTTVTASNEAGEGTETVLITIDPAPATIGLSNLTFTYDGNPKSPTVTTAPSGLPVSLTFNGSANPPINAGSYTVIATLTDPNYSATPATATLVIQPFAAKFTLPAGNSPFNAAFNTAYDGAPQGVNVTTSPSGVPFTITYNGSTTVPTLPGTYHVVVTSNNPNYAGTTEGTFVITVTALVRHAPSLSGDIDGSLQLLNGESFAVNNGVAVSDLLVPGTPTVQLNGKPLFGGIVNAGGAASPTNYSVTLNNGAVVHSVVRRVDPIAMPVVTAPALPAGTRSVTLTAAGQSFGAAATLRNLTLSASAGSVAVPAGVYGNFAVNGSNTLVLGVVGASEPAVYELQSLTIAHNASLKIVGPVTLKLASGLSLDGPLGVAAHPDWLDLQIASGGLTVNGGASVHGLVTAPNGTVILNGSVHGRVNADRLTISGSGVLEDSGL